MFGKMFVALFASGGLVVSLVSGAGAAVSVPLVDPDQPGTVGAVLAHDFTVTASTRSLTRGVGDRERVIVGVAAQDADGRFWIEQYPVRGGSEARSVIANAQTDTETVAVEVSTKVSLDPSVGRSVVVNDPLRPRQWALDTLNLDSVLPEASGDGVTIAVVDSGVDASHPDLKANLLPGLDLGADPGGNIANTTDARGHGTHVAGIASAVTNNGIGVASLASRAKILPMGIALPSGKSRSGLIALGVALAVDMGADVINMSLGIQTDDSVLRAAIRYAAARGVVMVTTSGNNRLTGSPRQWPGAYPETIAVAATDRNDETAIFSTMAPYVDVAAPGWEILSTSPGNSPGGDYSEMSGTSMSAPYVSGMAALLLQVNPDLTPDEVREIITATATDLGVPGYDIKSGWGLINPLAGIEAADPAIYLDADDRGKRRALKSGRKTTVVRGTDTNAEELLVKTQCLLSGKQLRGRAAKAACKFRVKETEDEGAKVEVTPRCSVHLKVRVALKAVTPGLDQEKQQRTWKVKNKPPIPCTIPGNS
jgi:subtilisin family serine protease